MPAKPAGGRRRRAAARASTLPRRGVPFSKWSLGKSFRGTIPRPPPLAGGDRALAVVARGALSRSRRAASLRAGARAGLPYAVAAGLVAVSFGVLAEPVLGTVAPIVMSATVFAGSAQFAALAVVAAGGGAITAVVAGILLNARYGPMGSPSRRRWGGAAFAEPRPDRRWSTSRGRWPTAAVDASTLRSWSAPPCRPIPYGSEEPFWECSRET